MKNPKADYNRNFAMHENFCKRGLSPAATAYLPVNAPVSYKIRVAELYARYKLFPVEIHRNRYFPGMGLSIVFIPFTHGLLGRYDKVTSKEDQEFLQYWIHHKVLKRREMIFKYPIK